MSHAPIPKNCFDVETAAHLLQISAVALYKFLREHDWLHTKTFKNDSAHNLPKNWASRAGYVTTQERGCVALYSTHCRHNYRVAILTRTGLEAVARIMSKHINLPQALPLAVENSKKIQSQQPSNEEREKALGELEAMGILSRKVG